MAEIVIDTFLCNGCGSCVELCPAVFRLNESTEEAELVTVDPEITDDVKQAAAYCPAQCIEVV